MTIYLDTCVVRFSQSERRQWLKKKEIVSLFGKQQEVEIVREHIDSPHDKLDNPEQIEDAKASVRIAKLICAEKLKGIWQWETLIEWGRSKYIGVSAPEINQHLEVAEAPFYYSRVLWETHYDVQFEFLRRLTHDRYEYWKKAIGFMEGTKRERNQLMDAWNLWTAEHNGCDYLLTTDYRLIRSIKSRKAETALKIATPTEFLNVYDGS